MPVPTLIHLDAQTNARPEILRTVAPSFALRGSVASSTRQDLVAGRTSGERLGGWILVG
jgi:hypothetical protein